MIITKGTFDEHLKQLDTVLEKLEMAGLKINATKSCFSAHELEYLGYWISRDGIQPLAAKIEAIKKISKPKNRRALRSFIGMINYYRDMWKRRSALLAPLTALTSENTPWKWEEKHQKAFDSIKKIISRETLLFYPNFDEPFDIHTDASNLHILTRDPKSASNAYIL